MKSTEIRDQYAEALGCYRDEVPVEQWPVWGGAISRSGLARVLRARGFSSFERKRLESSKCRPILRTMDEAVKRHLRETKVADKPASRPAAAAQADDAEVGRLRRRIEQLEKELRNAERREAQYRGRCALLEAEQEAVRRQHDAFEQHCHASLRTLHV